MTFWKWAACAALVVLGVGCRSDKLKPGGCNEDKDCGEPVAGYRCETRTGECYCRTNEGCKGQNEFCNQAGFCQVKKGCETNAECPSGLICDTSTGTCVAMGRCTTDLQCALGFVCDLSRNTCVEGCRSTGDCQKGACRCGDVPCVCSGTTPAEVAKCALGVCDETFCGSENDCRFGELCAKPDAGQSDGGSQADAGVDAGIRVERNACFADYDPKTRPYCDNCTFGGGTSVCGTGPNYCLIDTRNPGNSFCGADCSQGQSCPRGYGCSDVIVVFQQMACSRSNPTCATNPNLPCQKDGDCKRGGTCVGASDGGFGLCAGKCAVDEGDEQGFCTCQVDADCAQETCSMGECTISRRKCVGPEDCRTIRCVDFQGGGGCLIGQNCAPANGLSCVEVR